MSTAPTQTDSESLTDEQDAPGVDWSYRWTQFLFICCALGCFIIFWCGAKMLGIPAEERHGGSLLLQPALVTTVADLMCAVLLLAGCAWFAGAFLRTRWFLGGLTAATAGFSAWSMRGGPMSQITLYAPSAGVFIWLAAELLILGGIMGAAWVMLWQAPAEPADSPPKASVVGAIILQTLCMGVIVLILAQTDAKKQCLASVFLGGLIASSLAESSFHAPAAGRWYWVAPIAVGVVGYLLAAFLNPGWAGSTHILEGTLAPLARPLPLDYASAGMFGTLLGYWINAPGEENPDHL